MFSRGIAHLPRDAIFTLTELYDLDKHPQKVNLGQGSYKTKEGKPFVFPAVEEAKQRILCGNHEYLPILGLPAFRRVVEKLIFGKARDVRDNGVLASSQALSGTGSLHLAGCFLRRVSKVDSTVYITNPSWPNHRAVFERVGFPVKAYRYLDADGKLDFLELRDTLEAAKKGDIFVFHASAHNPSGRDPTREQWQEICEIVQRKQLAPLFDAAYLGLTSGHFENDVWPIRHFSGKGLELIVCLSFAKMMGLYGERIGALVLQTSSAVETAIVESHLENLMLTEIGNPPAFGARVVTEVLSDPVLEASWREDLKSMSLRLRKMRQQLVNELKRLGTIGPQDTTVKTN